MEFLSPWMLAGLALAPVLFLWGLLAPRGRPVVVGSLMLWRRALGAGPAGKPSARIRLKDPVLWLDAAAVILLVLACARPALRTTAPAEPVATLVTDRAAHMWIEARNPGRTRWQEASVMWQGVLRDAGMPPIRVISVPSDAGSVTTEETTSDALFRRIGDLSTPVLATTDAWPVAMAEAARRPEMPVVVATGVAPQRTLPPNVFVLAPGGTARNAGITLAAARIEGDRLWIFVKTRADADAPGPYRFSVVGVSKAFFDKQGFLNPGASAETTVAIDGPLPQQIRLQLVGPDNDLGNPHDPFGWDNVCGLDLAPAAKVRVVLAGEPDTALRRALAARPDTVVVEGAPDAKVPASGTDLVIASAAPLPADWSGPAAVIAPPDAVGPVRPRLAVAANGDGRPPAAAEWRVAAEHPLAAALYLEPPRLGAVRKYAVDSGAKLLLGTPDAPLMVTWDAGGARRLAVLFGFDERTTDWPRRAGFPVFWSHAIDWLVPQDRRAAEYRVSPIRSRGLAPAEPGFQIGSDEGFQAGPGRDDSQAAIEAIRKFAETKRRRSLVDLWPYLAAAALAALVVRAWLAR